MDPKGFRTAPVNASRRSALPPFTSLKFETAVQLNSIPSNWSRFHQGSRFPQPGAGRVKVFAKVALWMEPKFTVRVYRAEEGGYWAECPELPGCFTQGETMTEVRKNAREAISLYLETLAERMAAPHTANRRSRPVAELSFALAQA